MMLITESEADIAEATNDADNQSEADIAEATNDADNQSEADTAAATKEGIKNEADTTEAT